VRGAAPLVALGLALVLASCGGGSKETDPALIFVSTRDGEYALYGMSASGSDERRLTDAEVDASTPQGLLYQTEPAWSPDGSTIAYVHRAPGTSIRELWLVRPDGSQPRGLTKLGGVAQGPSWSPDGQQLVFSANVREGGFDIYTVRADGKGVHSLTSGEDAFEPAWSPDGETVAFSEAGAIVALDLANGEERTLTDPKNNDSSPTWRPEGRNE
jgi:Tol biopolymer transport system component